MAFELFPVLQWLDNNGNPLAGGLISTFIAGTNTPQATYTDSTGGTPQANPVVLDSAGRAQIWFAPASYKLVLKTASGVTLMTIDNVSLDNLAATISSLSTTGALTMQQPVAATALANQSSNVYSLQGTFWNGAASATDTWQFQNVLGTGANPTSTLILTHSGSSGAVTIDLSAATLKANLKNLNNIRFADQFLGSDMGAKITAAIADLVAAGVGGIVDARAFHGSQAAAATITVPQGITVLLGSVTLTLAGSPGINLSGQGAGVIGLGQGVTILQTSSGTADIIQTNNNFNFARGWSGVSSVARTDGAALRCKGGNGIFDNFSIDKTFNGISIIDSLSGATGNNKFTNFTLGFGLASSGSWNTGIKLGGVASGTVTSEVFKNGSIEGSAAFAGFMVELDSGCDTISFENCQFVQVSLGDSQCLMIHNTSTSNDPQWIKFTDCTFEAGLTKEAVVITQGILINFEGCQHATSKVAYDVSGTKALTIRDNKIVGMQNEAIILSGGTNIRISGNRIADTSLAANGGSNAIRTAANITDFSIVDNDFTTILASANQPFQNIVIPAGTSDRYWITGNTFANFNGVGLNDGGTGTNKFIHSNAGDPRNIFNGFSVAREVAQVDLTAQTAAIGTTTLYAVPATGAGQYRLAWDSKVTTAAGTSSTLGALTIVYTDPDGVAQTISAIATTGAGTVVTTNTGNNTTTLLAGLPLILNCKAGTNITYAMAYASNAANAMAYNLHLKLEAM
jgi:hypothetical protein